MEHDGFARDLMRFFKAARHLWGRCPDCGTPFRLSDARISTSPEPPRDWIRKLDRQQMALEEREQRLEDVAESLADRESELTDHERELRQREKYLERDARKRASDILNSDPTFQAIIRDNRKTAVMRSRSVLLGKLLECIAPCFKPFKHDPRDMRAIFNPVDYIIFNGLTVDRAVHDITFIEVKCGTSRLSPAQSSVRDAVEKRRVKWEVWQIGDPRIPIERQLGGGERIRLPKPRPDGKMSCRVVDLPPDG